MTYLLSTECESCVHTWPNVMCHFWRGKNYLPRSLFYLSQRWWEQQLSLYLLKAMQGGWDAHLEKKRPLGVIRSQSDRGKSSIAHSRVGRQVAHYYFQCHYCLQCHYCFQWSFQAVKKNPHNMGWAVGLWAKYFPSKCLEEQFSSEELITWSSSYHSCGSLRQDGHWPLAQGGNNVFSNCYQSPSLCVSIYNIPCPYPNFND